MTSHTDVISSDVHVLNVDGPAFDLLTTMSKFMVLGVDVNALVAAVTSAPARAIRRPSLGTLAVGTEGDATVVDVEQGESIQTEISAKFRLDTLAPLLVGAGMELDRSWTDPDGDFALSLAVVPT